MPIRLRLAILFAAGTALAAAIGGTVFVTELSTGLRASVLTSLQVRADAISQQFPDGGGGVGVQDPGTPLTPGSLAIEELTQLLGPTARIVDASGPGTSRPLLTASELAEARQHPLVIERAIVGQQHHFLLLAGATGQANPSVLVVGESLATVDQAVARVGLEITVGGAIGVVVAAIAAWLLAGAALRPVERMRRQAAEISEHDTDAVLAVPRSRDEIASLASTLNGLLERLHRALSRQRGFVSAAGHELRSPLAILKSELELAGRPGRSQAELVEAVDLAATEADRIIELADDLLLLSQSDEHALDVRLEPTDLRTLVEKSVSGFGTRAAEHGIAIEVASPPGLVADADERRYRQIIDNLIDNALRHAPEGSVVIVRLEARGGTAVLEVADQGPGFPPSFLAHAFERFGRPDESRTRNRGGTGLGLAIVKSLTEAHEGVAVVENGPAGGAVVRVAIPLRRPNGSNGTAASHITVP